MLLQRKSHGRLIFSILASCIFFGFPGCKTLRQTSGGEGIVLSSTVQLKSYVHLPVGGNGQKGSNFYFPILQVYGADGQLVYAGHETKANAAVLEQMPEKVKSLSPIPEAVLLPEIINEFPEFLARKDDLLGTQRTTIVSIFLEDCHACSIQEEALDSTQKRLLARGINLMIVRVERPR